MIDGEHHEKCFTLTNSLTGQNSPDGDHHHHHEDDHDCHGDGDGDDKSPFLRPDHQLVRMLAPCVWDESLRTAKRFFLLISGHCEIYFLRFCSSKNFLEYLILNILKSPSYPKYFKRSMLNRE